MAKSKAVGTRHQFSKVNICFFSNVVQKEHSDKVIIRESEGMVQLGVLTVMAVCSSTTPCICNAYAQSQQYIDKA